MQFTPDNHAEQNKTTRQNEVGIFRQRRELGVETDRYHADQGDEHARNPEKIVEEVKPAASKPMPLTESFASPDVETAMLGKHA